MSLDDFWWPKHFSSPILLIWLFSVVFNSECLDQRTAHTGTIPSEELLSSSCHATSTQLSQYSVSLCTDNKQKVEFWGRGENNLWALSLLLCKCGRTWDKNNVPWKAWLSKCPNIRNMACNSINIGTDFYATCSCSPIHVFLCTVLVTLPRLGQVYYRFDDSRTLQYTPILIC